MLKKCIVREGTYIDKVKKMFYNLVKFGKINTLPNLAKLWVQFTQKK